MADLSLTSSRRPKYLAFTLVALAVGLFAVSLRSGFVYDATAQIQEDDFIHTRANFADVLTLRVMSRDVLDFNRPMHLLSLMIDSVIWNRNPVGYHLTSILLHAGNSVLLFYLLKDVLDRWLGSMRRPKKVATDVAAALGTLVFVVHPVCVEAVAEPSYREDLLAGFFLLLALVLATRWRGWNWRLASLIAICAFASIASKEIGVMVAPMLASYWLLFRWPMREERKSWIGLVVVCAAIAGAFTGARFVLEPADSVVFTQKAVHWGGSIGSAMQNQPRAWAMYAWHLIVPFDLSADYNDASISRISLQDALVGLSPVVVLFVYLSISNRIVAFGSILLMLTILPASNLFPQYRPIADRYCYVPMTGVACFAAAGFAVLWPMVEWRRVAMSLWFIAMTGAAYLSFERQKVFANSWNLWTDVVRINPKSSTAQDNLGWALYEAGKYGEAIERFKTAADLGGCGADPFVGAALAFDAMGNTERANWAMNVARKIDSHYSDENWLATTMSLTKAQRPKVIAILKRQGPVTQ